MMNKVELIHVLENLAAEDTAEDAQLYDHPCTVAIRAINQYEKDIKTLRMAAKRSTTQSKRVQTLIKIEYSPSW